MQIHLYKISGYEETINSLRMSKGKFWSWEKAQEIQDLVYAVTNKRGEIATVEQYAANIKSLGLRLGSLCLSYDQEIRLHPKITGYYEKDVAEFKRLLSITMNQAMGENDHHTLGKYLDVTFITEGLHRGAQDDLDAHAMGFNNRITRFSTRLAVIREQEVSDWYKDKVIPFDSAIKLCGAELPQEIEHNGDIFKYTPFGYVLERFADMSENSGLRKDVVRGLMSLGTPGIALWKTDFMNLRYIYSRRSKLTKANPELKLAMEQLADQIETSIPVFGEKFRYKLTDTGTWEHMNKCRTVTRAEYDMIMKMKDKNYVVEEETEEV